MKNQPHHAAEFLVPTYSNVLPFSTLAKTYLQNNSENMKTKEIRQKFTDIFKRNSLKSFTTENYIIHLFGIHRKCCVIFSKALDTGLGKIF